MPKSQIFAELARYLPARVVRGRSKTSYTIVYYCLDPNTSDLRRVRIRANKIAKAYTRKKDLLIHLNSMAAIINAKLAGGWNPFFTSEESRYYTKLSKVREMFIAQKSRDLRPATMRSYASFVRIFCEWLDDVGIGDVFCATINKNIALRFLDKRYMEDEITARTYNNTVKLGRTFFQWACENGFAKENPFENIKVKRVDKKRRTIISEEYRKRMFDYFSETEDYVMLLVMNLVYGSFIRPNEIRQLKVGDINFEDNFILIKSSVAKTHYERKSILSNTTLEIMEKLQLRKLPKSYYIAGWNYEPSPKIAAVNSYAKRFSRVAKACGLPSECVLYSLRDTGIVDALHNGVDTLDLMHLADHHDLSITTRYADHLDKNFQKRVFDKLPSFDFDE